MLYIPCPCTFVSVLFVFIPFLCYQCHVLWRYPNQCWWKRKRGPSATQFQLLWPRMSLHGWPWPRRKPKPGVKCHRLCSKNQENSRLLSLQDILHTHTIELAEYLRRLRLSLLCFCTQKHTFTQTSNWYKQYNQDSISQFNIIGP